MLAAPEGGASRRFLPWLNEMATRDRWRRDIQPIYEAGKKIEEIVSRRGRVRQYVAKPYVGKTSIVDFQASADKGGPEP